jgi:hypothetical protein
MKSIYNEIRRTSKIISGTRKISCSRPIGTSKCKTILPLCIGYKPQIISACRQANLTGDFRDFHGLSQKKCYSIQCSRVQTQPRSWIFKGDKNPQQKTSSCCSISSNAIHRTEDVPFKTHLTTITQCGKKIVVLGSLVVSVLAIGPKVCGFKPGRGRWILRPIKSGARLPWEGK